MNINETAQKPPEPHQRQDKNSQELTELINQLSTASDILEEPKEQEVPEDEHSQELNDLLSSISSSSLEEKDEKAPGTKDSTQYNQKEDQIRTRYIPEPVPENTPSRSQKNDVTGPRTGPRKRHQFGIRGWQRRQPCSPGSLWPGCWKGSAKKPMGASASMQVCYTVVRRQL